MRSFAASDRFVADVKAGKLASGYIFVGDEAFFRKRCRDAVLQHLVPADVRELSLYDMDLGEGVKLDNDAARELVDSLGGDMMMVANELEKLVLFVAEKKRITLGDVETLVLAAKQRSFYDLTDAISSRDCARALAVLDAILT